MKHKLGKFPAELFKLLSRKQFFGDNFFKNRVWTWGDLRFFRSCNFDFDSLMFVVLCSRLFFLYFVESLIRRDTLLVILFCSWWDLASYIALEKFSDFVSGNTFYRFFVSSAKKILPELRWCYRGIRSPFGYPKNLVLGSFSHKFAPQPSFKLAPLTVA